MERHGLVLPYESPEVIAFAIDGGRAEYVDWITRATQATQATR
ncbi:divalent-cation tolerance protein CutA [Streptomyces sp. NBC_00335]|nr:MULTISPECIES: hypothetical protein [unclassified Streptomyces]MCX5403066.1 divalent-cation tolerance protein CutA [Streptomyces sp. NBC_00086]